MGFLTARNQSYVLALEVAGLVTHFVAGVLRVLCQMRSGMDGCARDEVRVKKVRLECKSQQHPRYLTSLPGQLQTFVVS